MGIELCLPITRVPCSEAACQQEIEVVVAPQLCQEPPRRSDPAATCNGQIARPAAATSRAASTSSALISQQISGVRASARPALFRTMKGKNSDVAFHLVLD